MNETKLKAFLKDYAEILKAGVDISDDLPLSWQANMPAGGIEVFAHDGRSIAFISVEEGLGPSMPVGPAAMTYAELFTELINKYHDK